MAALNLRDAIIATLNEQEGLLEEELHKRLLQKYEVEHWIARYYRRSVLDLKVLRKELTVLVAERILRTMWRQDIEVHEPYRPIRYYLVIV